MTQRGTMALTPRRRNVLALRACGYSQAEIARRLGITEGVVRKDHRSIAQCLVPGVTDRANGSHVGYTITYAMGLLDAGVDPADIPAYIAALEDRVAMRLGQAIRKEAERTNP
jgi:hypothetical protein